MGNILPPLVDIDMTASGFEVETTTPQLDCEPLEDQEARHEALRQAVRDS